MVLNNYRAQGDRILLPMAKILQGVDPNVLSWVALLFAILAGSFFYIGSPFFVLLGGIAVLFNSIFDAVDGRVAKLTGKDSLKGDFLDHTFDRYADIFIIGGIAFGPLSRLSLGFLAILGILMTSYMGTQAHAVGVKRNYGGVAGRADRLVLLLLLPIIYYVLYHVSSVNISAMGYELGLFEILMIWFALAGNLTAIHRGIETWKELKIEK